MPALRVLRLISNLDVGGVQRQMLLQLRELKSMGVEPQVCVIDERGRLAPQFEEAGIPVHHIRFRSRLDPIGIVKLRRLVNREGINILHTHMYGPAMGANLAFRWRGELKLINGYHNQILVHSKSQERRVRASHHVPDAFVAVGNSVRDSLVALGVPTDKIHVVHNGVIGPPETPLPPVNDMLRLVWMGRFVKQKRVEFLVEVAIACKKANVPVHLTLLGDGGSFFRLRRRVKEEGYQDLISMPGTVTDVFTHLAQSHVYVSASYREGFPNALLEACAAGRPFVVSDIEPHRELLGEAKAGIVLPMEVEKWVSALGELNAAPHQLRDMAAESRRLGEIYSISAAAKKMLALYQTLAGGKDG